MYKKIAVIVSFLLAVVLVYLRYRYFQAQKSTAFAAEKVILLNDASDNFSNYGFIICILSLVLVNITSLKTKQLFWLLLPFLFTVFVAYAMSYQAENIFIFTKDNGMWEGGFSLSSLLSIIIIAVATILLTINYFVLKNIISNKK